MSSEIYQDVNWEEIIPNLENAARNLAYSNNGSIFIQDVLPFIKTVRPKVASTDSLFYDMTLICLARRMEDEGSLVNEGLKPLIDSKIKFKLIIFFKYSLAISSPILPVCKLNSFIYFWSVLQGFGYMRR